jgi:hypothetical protein
LLLAKEYKVRRDLALQADDGAKLRLRFGSVKPSVGYRYQRELHYLKCIRADTFMHLGLFLPGAEYPLAYVAISKCDRPYIADAVIAGRMKYKIGSCLVLTRMYGLPGLPANLMSLTLRSVIGVLRKSTAASILLTAYNPLLGFDGAAFRASGFHPFATAPVDYRYSTHGEFTTRRCGGADVLDGGRCMPNNVILARGIDRKTQREIVDHVRVENISPGDYQVRVNFEGSLPDVDASVWLKELRNYRNLLEAAWSSATIHPSYLADDEDSSNPKGQCGVSSVWLVNELRSAYHVRATYCYGDLRFVDGVSRPVDHHCWVEIGEVDDPMRLVIDLTCDQAESIDNPVLCARHDRLQDQGLNYVAHNRIEFLDLPRDRVWRRYNQLADAMESTSLV